MIEESDKQMKENINIQEIIERYKIAKPPELYCPQCGTKLVFEYKEAARHPEGKYSQVTGKERFVVKGRYNSCPLDGKHDTGPATLTAQIDTASPRFWCWKHIFSLIPIE